MSNEKLTEKTLADVQAGIPARDAEIEALRKESTELREQLEAIEAGVANGKPMPGTVSAEPVRFNWNEHLQQSNSLQYQHDFDLLKVVAAYVDRHIFANAAPFSSQSSSKPEIPHVSDSELAILSQQYTLPVDIFIRAARQVIELYLATTVSAKAQPISIDQKRLRDLVDVVWNEVTESTAVPDSPWADRLIDKVFGNAQAQQYVSGGNLADRLDVLADTESPGSQMQSDLYAAATIWRKHLKGPAAQQPVSGADETIPRHVAATLANAIYEAAQKIGIANRDHINLSVGQCLHLLDCMAGQLPGNPGQLDHLPDATKMVDSERGAIESALAELVDKIMPGLDTGDLLADAATASKALDAQPSGNAGELPLLPKPDSYLFQHEETGLTECVDGQQVEWGFEKNNPRHQRIGGMFTETQMKEYARIALAQQDADKVDAERYRALRSGETLFKRLYSGSSAYSAIDYKPLTNEQLDHFADSARKVRK